MVLALTHRSFAGRNNERLEFLGDAILNFVAGEALFERFPQAREGQLSRLRARLVKGETLAVLARGFGLGEYLRLGSGELKSGGFRRESILADALEALIGAIYLDAGMEAAKERVTAWLTSEIESLTLVDTNKDPKTRLQEFLQSRGCELHGVSVDDSIASIERIFKNDAEPKDIAAIIIEPVQGEGGFYVAPKAFMARLRELCDKHGILLIADEVQTGAGRTGTFFAMEQMGVTADLTTFAKSIAGGFPLAGVCGKAEYMDAIAPGGLGGTYAGSPIACAAALAVLDVFEEEHLLDRCKEVGERLVTGLKAIQAKHPVIGDVRALGAMIAVELFEGGDSHKPNPTAVAQVVAKARDKGLILLSCGTYGNVLRVLVPLTSPNEQLDKGLAIIEECFAELA